MPDRFLPLWTDCPNPPRDVTISKRRHFSGRRTMRVRGYADGTPCWAAVATSDVGASRAFYSALFGWQFADGRFALEGRAVAGVRERGPGPSAWLISISTDDAHQVTHAVEDARGRVRVAPQPAGPGGAAAYAG